ncbi:hypothetical protein INT48_001172 [Thamnidium elegans]|uniref:Reverse transcriptase domain-containing protein n=1 Tax=Thamnidium elegans TaxID=101142 RepID=A0A8H7VQG2_9FUNG|nr:hypothetical protein INT48_001172 [Thamnidium elegans]
MLMKLITANARPSDSNAIGLLLDQEKAYDRVHPEYLSRVLKHFGFPLNINGRLSRPVPQLRGLRQGRLNSNN